MAGRRRWLLAAMALGACAGSGASVEQAAAPLTSTTTSSTTTTTTTAPPGPRVVDAPLVLPGSEPLQRSVTDQPWVPFAQVGPIVLQHPSSRVERVAFHESNLDGAQMFDPLSTAVAPITLESRERGTGSRTAADVVVEPDSEIRAPVTGRVLRAGTYVLYCRYSDDYVVIEPEGRPGWEVKLLHIDRVQVRAGDRVVAGETVLAPRATVLPFESQVDEVSSEPVWPHPHIEVVDPMVPDRPGPSNC